MKTGKKYNDGFTLPEVLITVAILVIVLAFGIVGVARYRDYLKITELDNIAREIYMAAENRVVLLQNSGAAKSQVSSLTESVNVDGKTYNILAHTPTAAPGSFDEFLPLGSIDPALREGHFFVLYDKNTGHAAEVFYAEKEKIKEAWLPALRKRRSERVRDFRSKDADAPTCLVGHYQGDVTDMADSDVKILPTPGVEVFIENGNELTLTVRYALPADMPKKPDGTALPVIRTPSVSLEYEGRKVDLMSFMSSPRLVKKSGDITTSATAEYTWVLDSLETQSGDDKTFTKQFKDLFPSDSGLVFGGDFTVTAGLTLTADGCLDSAAYAQGTDNSLFAKGSATASADPSDPSVPDRSETALIANLRHLQNLSGEPSTYAYMSTEEASQFTSNVVKSESGSYSSRIKKAEQTADIECRDYRGNDGRELNSKYNFSAINNPVLIDYDGKGYELRNLYSDNRGGGLFNQTGAAGMTFQHIRLIAPEIRVSHKGGVDPAGLVMMLTGSDNTLNDVWAVNATIYGEGGTNPAAGGLVGIIGGQDRDTKVTINNCRVFWEDETGTAGKSVSQLLTKDGQIDYKITSKFAGGLVGICASNYNHTYELKITNSFAATTIKSCHPAGANNTGAGQNACIGGLVGGTGYHDSTEGTVKVTIENSYADCYFGEEWKVDGKPVYIGGLVGSNNSYAGSSGSQDKASLTIKNSYAAGFIVNPRDHVKSAGLANDQKPGKITAQNCYSVVRVKKDAAGKETLDKPETPMYPGWNESSPGNSALYLSTVADVTAALGGAFEYETGEPETHAYDLRYEMSKTPGPAKEALKLTPPYPFPGLKDVNGILLPHYDDWAELENKTVSLELVYYEGYAKEENNVDYGLRFSKQFIEANKDCKTPEGKDTPESKVLSDFPLTEPEDKVVRTIYRDGYALAVKADELASLKTQKTKIVWSSTTENSKSYTWTLSWIEDQGKWQWEGDVSSEGGVNSTAAVPINDITVEGSGYTLIPLPVEMVYGDKVPFSRTDDLRYYQKLAVTTDMNAERTFYFNPHLFIEIQGPGADGAAPAEPNHVGEITIKIRTPRHFYDLSRYYKADNGDCYYPQANVGDNNMRIFKQVFDLDYTTYNGLLSANERGGLFFRQMPIKSDTYFTYDGQCRRIQNVFVNGTEGSVGLFGVINNNSKLENIVFEMDPANTRNVEKAEFVGALLGQCDNGGMVVNCAVYGVNINATAARYIGGLVGYLNNRGSVQGCSAEVACLDGRGVIGGLVGTVQSQYAFVTNSYAVGYINKTSGDGNVCGLVGSMSSKNVEIQNCYAAVHLESNGSKYGLCNNGKASTSYWLTGTFRYRGVEYTANTSTYTTDNNSKGTPITPDQLAAQLAAKLPAFTQSADTMTVKNIADANYEADYTGNFPYFTSVKGVLRNTDGTVIKYSDDPDTWQPIHYGLWPVEIPPEVTMFYYEQYADGRYGFYRAIRETGKAAVIVDTLVNEKVIVRDGYALAVKKKDLPWFASGSGVSVQYGASGKPKTFIKNEDNSFQWFDLDAAESKGTAPIPVQSVPVGDGKTEEYVMLPLWYSVHTGDLPGGAFPQSLYVRLLKPDGTVLKPDGKTEYMRTFYFNPHFAKTLSCPAEGSAAAPDPVYPTTGQGKELSETPVPIYVRTARHFYALSQFTERYVANRKYYFLQECDVDYRTYTGYEGLFELNGESVYEQRVIGQGSSKDPNVNTHFIGTYDGGGRRLKNVVFTSGGIKKQGLGLFGVIGENGRLRNIIYEPGGSATVNCNISADRLYAGGLAGSNFKGKIENCAVLGFGVKIVGGSNTPPTINNFYVGSLVAMNQSGTISNCFAEVRNLTVPTKTEANAEYFIVGALAGTSYGKNDSNWGMAHVNNCYAVGMINGGDGARIAGLVGRNGSDGYKDCEIINSYSAAALEGNADKYNICSPFSDTITGTVSDCYYLSGIWNYGGSSHTTGSQPGEAVYGTGITGKTYDELAVQAIDGMSLAADGYPFPVSTKDKDGNYCYLGTDKPANDVVVTNADLPDESVTALSEPEETEGAALDTAENPQDGPGTALSEPEETEGAALDPAENPPDESVTALSEQGETEGSELDPAESPQDGPGTDPPAEKPGGTPPALMPESSDKSGLITEDESDGQTAP